jgi:hypothetical protein
MAEPVFMKLGVHNMPLGSISTAYFMNPSLRSVFSRQRFRKNVTAAANTQVTIEELLEAPFPMLPVS